MLNHVDFNRHMTDIEYRLETREVRGELAQLQHRMKESKLPVIVLFEGWDSSGKGSMIASMIQTLDPRFFKVYNTKDPTPGGPALSVFVAALAAHAGARTNGDF